MCYHKFLEVWLSSRISSICSKSRPWRTVGLDRLIKTRGCSKSRLDEIHNHSDSGWRFVTLSNQFLISWNYGTIYLKRDKWNSGVSLSWCLIVFCPCIWIVTLIISQLVNVEAKRWARNPSNCVLDTSPLSSICVRMVSFKRGVNSFVFFVFLFFSVVASRLAYTYREWHVPPQVPY